MQARLEDLALIQTSLLFHLKCQQKQLGLNQNEVCHPQPHCHAEARSLSRKLWSVVHIKMNLGLPYH